MNLNDPKCQECNFELYTPLVEFKHSILGLYDDCRYPGRCILALKNCRTEFHTLSADLLVGFSREMQIAGRAIKTAGAAYRVNYAILGNAEPHIHAHIIPRLAAGDPVPTKSPWNNPNPANPLATEIKKLLIERISEEIKRYAF